MGLNFYCFLLFGAFLPACLADLSRAHNADALSALKSMVDKRAISPEQQKVCSNYYFPLMEDVSTSYDAALQACHDTAAKAHADAAGTASVTYEEIQTMSSGLCNKNCDLAFQQTQDYLALFECYNAWATASLNTLFSVSGNATLARNTWNDAQANIENDELKCLAVAFEDYQVRWNAEAQAWNQCVIGNGLTIATTQAPYPTTSTVRTTTWPTTSTVRTTTRPPTPTTSTVRSTTWPTTSTVRSTTWVSTPRPPPTTTTGRTTTWVSTTRPSPTTTTRTTTRPTTSTLRTTTSRPLPPIESTTTTYIPQPPLETTTSGLRTTTQFVPPAPVVSTQPPPTTTDRPLLAVFHPIINRPL